MLKDYINVKPIYQAWALANELPTSGGLKAAISNLDIPDIGKIHNAGRDAWYTLKVFLKLQELLYENK